jgi:hypothetical protein
MPLQVWPWRWPLRVGRRAWRRLSRLGTFQISHTLWSRDPRSSNAPHISGWFAWLVHQNVHHVKSCEIMESCAIFCKLCEFKRFQDVSFCANALALATSTLWRRCKELGSLICLFAIDIDETSDLPWSSAHFAKNVKGKLSYTLPVTKSVSLWLIFSDGACWMSSDVTVHCRWWTLKPSLCASGPCTVWGRSALFDTFR